MTILGKLVIERAKLNFIGKNMTQNMTCMFLLVHFP